MTSEAQILAIAKGDRAAFSVLYQRLAKPMQRYATGLLAGDTAAAEDVVDDAFFDVWRKADAFAGTGSADGWVRRIVRNKAIDWLRKCHESVGIPDQALANHHAAVEALPNPEDLAIQQSEAAWLRDALNQLTMEHREAIWLCYFEDRSLADIAAIAGCPENTVKTRLFHARQKLKGAMTTINHQS